MPIGIDPAATWTGCSMLPFCATARDDFSVTLVRPDRISEGHWEAVRSHEARLTTAYEAGDRALVVGAAKELCECVAGVVCAELAQATGTGDDFGALLTAAHTAVDRRPGRGAAAEGAVRDIAQAARSIVTQVNTLRNEVGTGHGRPSERVVTREVAAIAMHAGRLWVAWTLARLDEVLRGEVAGLVHELQTGSFRKGLLAERLVEVDLRSLHSEDQRRIGVAVARRASGGGTFVVRWDGIDPLRSDAEAWPEAYRNGIAAGLLLDIEGRLALRAPYVDVLAALVGIMDPTDWVDLSAQACVALWANDLASDGERQTALVELLQSTAPTLDDSRRKPWNRILAVLQAGDAST